MLNEILAPLADVHPLIVMAHALALLVLTVDVVHCQQKRRQPP